MIQMICGSTRIGAEIFSAASGAFNAPAEAEKRLVDSGAAVYVGVKPVATSGESGLKGDTGVNIPNAGNATGGLYEPVDDIPNYDMEMTAKELREIAENEGLTVSPRASKKDIVNILDEHFGVADIEDIPDITADDVVT